jgi:hypothetical protein
MAERAYGADWNVDTPQLGMEALWRLAIWGGIATFALFLAVISAFFSHPGSARQTAPIAAGPAAQVSAAPASATQVSATPVPAAQVPASQVSTAPVPAAQVPTAQTPTAPAPAVQAPAGKMSASQSSASEASPGPAPSPGPATPGQGAAQPRTSAGDFAPRSGEAAEETRRLAEAVRSLAADRDQVLVRVTALERGLDGVTGSIRRDRFAGPPTPSPGAAPTGRTETPAVPKAEAAVAPAPPPAAPQADVALAAAPDAGNPAAVSNPVRAGAPAEPLAVAAGLGVDVGGATNYEGLRTLWHSTRNSDPTLMEELFPLVSVRENGKTHGAELRLVVGPIGDAEAAARLCTALAAAHHYCQPVAFEGQRLSKIDTPAGKAASAPHPGQPPRVPSILK